MQYPTGILAEHQAVRTGAGHLRRLPHGRVRGHRPRPERLRQPGHLQRRRARSSRAGCSTRRSSRREGTFVDDCTVYRFDDKLMIVVNAVEHAQGVGAHRRPEGRRQRPAQGHLGRRRPARGAGARAEAAAAAARRHRRSTTSATTTSPPGKIAGRGVLHLAHRLHRRGRLRALLPRARHRRRCGTRCTAAGAQPIGLGARDSLRLEMGYAALRQRHRRHHHAARGRPRLDREARQGRAVHRATTRSARRRQRGVTRKLVGFQLAGRGIPRHGYPVYYEGGRWTSSGAAP